MQPRRILCLDGLRGLAVLMVICFHFQQMFGCWHGLLARLAVWGQTGVDLFFVLSGFLITGILLDTRGSEHCMRNFYVRRVLRIFPLYYATLAVLFVVAPLIGLRDAQPVSRQIWFWTYMQNIPLTFGQSMRSDPVHFWSLAVEEHFYLVWPFLVLRLNHRSLLRAVLVMIAASVSCRILLSQYSTFYFTLARMDGLGCGAALAVLARDPGGLRRLVRPAWAVLLFVGSGLGVLQLALSGSRLEILQITKSTLIAFVYCALIVLAVGNRLLDSVLTHPALRNIGKYSYAMYIFHPFVLGGLKSTRLPSSSFDLLLAIAFTWCAAALSWFALEEPFLKMKVRFEYAPRPLAVAVSA